MKIHNYILRYEENVNINTLTANPNHIMIHTQEQQLAMQLSLKEYGWLSPIIVNENTGYVFDGHMRVLCAHFLEIEEVPVIYLRLHPAHEFTLLGVFNSIGKAAIVDLEKLDEMLVDLETGYEKGFNFLRAIAKLNIIPAFGNLLRSRKKKPLEQQKFIRETCAKGKYTLHTTDFKPDVYIFGPSVDVDMISNHLGTTKVL